VVENQRWRLIAAAAEALAERGWAAITVADIAARAHVSRGTFYEQFDDLVACLLAAHEMVADCICDLAGSCRGAEEDGAGLRSLLEEILRFLAEEPALAHLLGPEVAVGVPEIAVARERLLERLGETGAGRRPLEGAFALVSERLETGRADSLPELAPQLTELIRRGAGPGRRRPGAPAM
jgi:AcrR family transcriptional regulator